MSVIHFQLDEATLAKKRGWREMRGLGDVVERLAKPIAVALKMPCLDAKRELKPESPCAKRRDKLNSALPFTKKQTTN